MSAWKMCLSALLFSVIILPTAAQHCPLPIESDCDDIGRDEICIVGGDVLVTTWGGDTQSAAAGDMLAAADVAEVQLDAGVVRLNLGLTFPASQPERTAAAVFYGTGTLTSSVNPDDVQPPATLTGAASDNLNLRDGPDTRYFVVNSLLRGDTVTVIGRNDTGDWLLIEQPDMPLWGFAPVIAVEGDINNVPVVGRGEVPPNEPGNALWGDASLRIEPSGCGGGLLLQSPPVDAAQMTLNGQTVQVAGTVLFDGIDKTLLTGTAAIDANPLTRADNAPRPSIQEIIDLPVGLLPDALQYDLAGTVLLDMATCDVQRDGELLDMAPADEIIFVGRAMADTSAETLAQVIGQAQVTLMQAETAIPLQGIRRYQVELNNQQYEVADWLFALRDLDAGDYALTLTVENSAVGEGGGWDNVYPCVLKVE